MNDRLWVLVLGGILLFGAGCPKEVPTFQGDGFSGSVEDVRIEKSNRDDWTDEERAEALEEDRHLGAPVQDYLARKTYRSFGEEFRSRFSGYHTGDDSEFEDVAEDVPVQAVGDGVVRVARWVSGYGGVIIATHEWKGEEISVLYGHLRTEAFAVRPGDVITRGQTLGVLGTGGTRETDGERKHLHIAAWVGTEDRFLGYVANPVDLSSWINPAEVFGTTKDLARPLSTFKNPESTAFSSLELMVPAGMDVEYVPGVDALNIYTISGTGSARDRSQIFIRFFDAADFLTLSTVDIFSTKDVRVGMGEYAARQYEIQKKSGVANFPGQPVWRNERHFVTDVRAVSGASRFFVIAKNPDLDQKIFDEVLSSISFEKR